MKVVILENDLSQLSKYDLFFFIGLSFSFSFSPPYSFQTMQNCCYESACLIDEECL